METGDYIVQGVPIVVPAGSPAQTFEVDFSLAVVIDGPTLGGFLGPMMAGTRLYAEATASGVVLRQRNVAVRVAKLTGGANLAASRVQAGGAPGAIVRGRRVRS